MNKIFAGNLYSLRQVNTVVAVLSACFMIFPIVFEKNLPKAGIYLVVSMVAMLLALYSKHKHNQHIQGKKVSNLLIYALIILFYTNAMMFGMYLGVWANPEKLAVTFMGFLICALFLFVNPPIFNLLLTLSMVIIFIISTILMKSPQNQIFDIVNVLIAGAISLIFTWYIVMHKLLAVLSAIKLEEERNSYYCQSTEDELTQLKNRRDFMQTFQRYFTDYRDSDKYLCLAIIDIDYFKNYNDYYGHPQGDECLRAIGNMLNLFGKKTGVYAARIGGEEFALLWFTQEMAEANDIVPQIRKQINDLNIPHARSKVAEYITISIGIYVTECGVLDNLRMMYELADQALYEAKTNGRNCAVIQSEAGRRQIIRADFGFTRAG
jgi:diguanylate cyclase (GGDEF)-like protein